MEITKSTPEKISFKIKSTSGVYFLKKDGVIVYVGKSTNVMARIFSDHYRVKDFDEVEIHWLEKDVIGKYESQQIDKHKPKLNDVGWVSKTTKTRQRFNRIQSN